MTRTKLVTGMAVSMFLTLCVYFLIESYLPPIEMDPLPPFAKLCESQEGSDAYLKGNGVEPLVKGGLWEEKFDLVPGHDQLQDPDVGLSSYFDFSKYDFFARMTSPSGKVHQLPLFYDGEGKFKVRAWANEAGVWRYEVGDGTRVLERGDFSVLENTNSSIHPIVIDPDNPVALRAGREPFYWIGGKWIASQNIAPCSIWQFRHQRDDQQALKDDEYLAYLDHLQAHKQNGILIKLAQFPLLGDGVSWDLAWIQRTEWMVKEALKRGIYVQLNIFDTWSRDKRYKVVNNTSGAKHTFNVWEPEANDLTLIENYLKTVVARFAAFPNIMWELGNEMEHKPNCGECFADQAEKHYLPRLRALDPYQRLVGLSEDVWQKTSVDVGFLHQTTAETFEGLFSEPRPLVMNELVFSDDTDPLWRDSTIRDEENRFAFRRTFWRSFMTGLSGSFEATWLNIQDEFNDAIHDVSDDHMRLAEFIERHKIDVTQRALVSGILEESEDYYSYSMNLPELGSLHYLVVKEPSELSDWDLKFDLPSGFYKYQIFDPATGEYSEFSDFNTRMSSTLSIEHEGLDILVIVSGKHVGL